LWWAKIVLTFIFITSSTDLSASSGGLDRREICERLFFISATVLPNFKGDANWQAHYNVISHKLSLCITVHFFDRQVIFHLCMLDLCFALYWWKDANCSIFRVQLLYLLTTDLCDVRISVIDSISFKNLLYMCSIHFSKLDCVARIIAGKEVGEPSHRRRLSSPPPTGCQ
jgi:hypothetical protein